MIKKYRLVGILLTTISLVACQETSKTNSKTYVNPFLSDNSRNVGNEITPEKAKNIYNDFKNVDDEMSPSKITHTYGLATSSFVEKDLGYDSSYIKQTTRNKSETMEVDRENLFYHYKYSSVDVFTKFDNSEKRVTIDEERWCYYDNGYLINVHSYKSVNVDWPEDQAIYYKEKISKEDAEKSARFSTYSFEWHLWEQYNFEAFKDFIDARFYNPGGSYTFKEDVALNNPQFTYKSNGIKGNLAVVCLDESTVSRAGIETFPSKEADVVNNVNYCQKYNMEIYDYFTYLEEYNIITTAKTADGETLRTSTESMTDMAVEECERTYPTLSNYRETDGDFSHIM